MAVLTASTVAGVERPAPSPRREGRTEGATSDFVVPEASLFSGATSAAGVRRS